MDFDPSKPFLFIHVSKTGGTALRKVFEQWYGDRLGKNYYNNREKKPCDVIDLNTVDCIYGHFKSDLGIGIERYPTVNQYMMFLRHPISQQVSYYNYRCQFGEMPDIDEFFKTSESMMNLTVPKDVDLDKVFFVGLYERFDDDVRILSDILSKPFIKPPVINVTKNKIYPSKEAVDAFRDNNKRIFDIYYYFLGK